MAPLTKHEYENLPEWQKREAIWEWLETIEKSIAHLNGNVQLLHERLRKLENSAALKE